MKVQVKICGLKTPEMVAAAVQAGADYVGFVTFPRSPRHVTPQEAAALKPSGVPCVSVLVNPDDALLRQVKEVLSPAYVQLHDTSLERAHEIRTRFAMKVILAMPERAIGAGLPSGVGSAAEMLLFDTTPPKDSQLPGGNGIAFDWKILKDAQIPLPWFLSGGLTPANVAQALAQSGATMVDVSSGVESSAGVKDAHLITQFIKAATA
jgi:phosphoribosylanthranilate isomerase